MLARPTPVRPCARAPVPPDSQFPIPQDLTDPLCCVARRAVARIRAFWHFVWEHNAIRRGTEYVLNVNVVEGHGNRGDRQDKEGLGTS